MKKLILILMFCIFSTGIFAQSIRGTVQLGYTETLWHNEMTCGVSFAYENLYFSSGGTLGSKYDYHAYSYVNSGYIFNINRYFSMAPIIGYGFQKGYSRNYHLFNYGMILQGLYPVKKKWDILVNIEATRHHTCYGLGFKRNF